MIHTIITQETMKIFWPQTYRPDNGSKWNAGKPCKIDIKNINAGIELENTSNKMSENKQRCSKTEIDALK